MGMTADPSGRLAEAIKKLGQANNLPEPVLGTWDEDSQRVLLDTGQAIYRPIFLVERPLSGQRVLAIWYQRGHAVAIIPVYEQVGSS